MRRALTVLCGALALSDPTSAQDHTTILRVVDADGTPRPGVTVRFVPSLAVFGMPKDVEARLTVVPAGWIGPTDGFPTVAAMLGREPATLVVPPHGRFRVRAVRAGRPVRVRASGASLHEPTPATASASTREVHGFEFGPVALGLTLRGTAHFMERSVRFGHWNRDDCSCGFISLATTLARPRETV